MYELAGPEDSPAPLRPLPVFDQILADNPTMEDVFTMCFAADGQSGGMLIFGAGGPGLTSALPSTPANSDNAVWQFVTYTDSANFYSVHVSAFAIVSAASAGAAETVYPYSIDTAGMNTETQNWPIVDSGSTDLQLPYSVYAQVQSDICSAASALGIPQLCTSAGAVSYTHLTLPTIA